MLEPVTIPSSGKEIPEDSGCVDPAESYRPIDVVDLTPQIIILAETLKFKDIFDRLIMATARYLGVPLVSSDREITKSGLIETVWD